MVKALDSIESVFLYIEIAIRGYDSNRYRRNKLYAMVGVNLPIDEIVILIVIIQTINHFH